MMEVEWLTCTDPERMLEFLKGRASDRKLRLFSCACCRRIWTLLDGWSQNAVAVSEQYVDGSVGKLAMSFAADLHQDVILKAKPYTSRHIAAAIANSIMTGAAWALAWNTVSEVRRAIRADSPQVDTYSEAKSQAATLKDIIGNPFRPVTLDPACLTTTVDALARAIYDERAFARLPTLADALEEAGPLPPAGAARPRVLGRGLAPGQGVTP